MSETDFHEPELTSCKPAGAGRPPGTTAGAKKNPRAARAFAGVVLSAALLGAWGGLSAQEPDKQDTSEEPEIRLHEPLAGQTCKECHEEAVPVNKRCLIAGEEMCVLCHVIPPAGGQASLAEPTAEICFKCHDMEAFKGDFTHGPVASGDCLTCHSPHGSDDRAMVRITGRQLCLACHEEMKDAFAKARFRHEATANGCTDCHSPHASNDQYQLRKSAPDACAGCHEDIIDLMNTAAVTHSPVQEEAACLNCHTPHVSEIGRLLNQADMDVCLECHDEPIEIGQEELQLMGQLLEEKPLHHGPIQFRECSECHNPHGSPYFRLLTDMYPERLYAPFFESNYALCFRCHESTLAEEEQADSLTEFRDGERNLHFLHVNKTSMGRTCRLCHDAHAGSEPQYIPESVTFGNWDLPIKFTKTENGGSCEPGCHAAQSYDRLAPQPSNP